MKKKKILFAITKGNWGGAQKYVFDLATNLPTEDFEIAVLCGAGDKLQNKFQEKDIRVIRLTSLDRNINIIRDIKSFLSFYKILRDEKPDILHLNSSKIGGIGGLAGRLARVPQIIFTGHGWAWNEERSLASKVLIAISHWFTIIFAHKTIAVSLKIRQEISSLPLIPKSKIIVIHNGISDTEYEEHFAARASLDGKILEKFWVGSIAELHKNKGLDGLISAFSEVSKVHPDTALIIVGEGEERANLQKLIDELGLAKKVHLLGFVDNARCYLKAFDVFVLNSRTEAFPYVPLEAGLAQLPVIATKVGGIPEVIADEKNGLLVSSGDTYGLNIAIKNLLNDSTKAAILGHNLRKTVEKEFSIEKMVEKTLAVYNS